MICFARVLRAPPPPASEDGDARQAKHFTPAYARTTRTEARALLCFTLLLHLLVLLGIRACRGGHVGGCRGIRCMRCTDTAMI